MFESFFFRAREAFLLVDRNGTIVDANRSTCRFLKRDREELAGMPVGYLFDSTVIEDMLNKADRADEWTRGYVSLAYGGEDRIDIRGIRLSPANGQHLYALEISRDTVRREALDQLRDELASALMTVRRERQTARNLQFSNEKLTAFAHRVAHDIRGPLRNIRLALNLCRDSERYHAEERESELLAVAEQSAEQLDGLIVGLLEYSKSTAQGVNRHDVDLNSVVKVVSKSLTGPEEGPWISVESLPVVRADRALMELIFQNLLSNTRKFASSDRHLRVRVSVSGQGDAAEIRISDNGIGFSDEARERIFELFGREDHGRDGAGIGLATCAELVAQHGWGIDANGAPGEGAVFSIRIPWTDVVQLREAFETAPE